LMFTDESVHLQDFPVADKTLINEELEKQIEISQRITSLILRIRKLEGIKVRQPLSKAIIPALSDEFAENLKKVQEVIKSEVNIKEIEIIDKNSSIIKKSCKANFKILGAKVGKDMKTVADQIAHFDNDIISKLENGSNITIHANGQEYALTSEDIEIKTADIPGWQIMSDANYTVALDLELTEDLKTEGIARELINKIQNLRKDKDFEVTDKIKVSVENHAYIQNALNSYNEYICGEILAEELVTADVLTGTDTIDIDTHILNIQLSK
jgi:isoleucyl-tRNA synthetase